MKQLTLILALSLFAGGACAGTASEDVAADGGENPSNPLSKGKNTDLHGQYFDRRDGSERYDYYIDGAFMASDKLKIKYELHYWDTDVTGRSEQDWESFHLKGIYFPKEGRFGDTPYRLAVGLELIQSFDNQDKGIGGGSDIISPFVGVALGVSKDLMIIPLVQHYEEYDGPNVQLTAARLIGLWKLPNAYWASWTPKCPMTGTQKLCRPVWRCSLVACSLRALVCTGRC